jgi:hypothetical protein
VDLRSACEAADRYDKFAVRYDSTIHIAAIGE